MVGSIQELLQRQARHVEERDTILLHQRLELVLLQVLLAFAQFIEDSLIFIFEDTIQTAKQGKRQNHVLYL